MKYTWLVERVKAIQTLKQILGIGYVDAVVKYNEIIEFLNSVEDIKQKGIDSLEFVIFMLRGEHVLAFETQKDKEDNEYFEENKEEILRNEEAQEWFDKQTDLDKEMINRLIKMNQVGPAMG